MGFKEDLKQAAKELMSAPKDTGSSKKEAARPHADPLPFPVQGGTAEAKQAPSPRTTLIAEGVIIQGDLQVEGSLELYGQVTGNIVSKGDLKLSGKLTGNAQGKNIQLYSGQVDGDVVAQGQVQIDQDSVVVGNVQAKTLTLNGKVKGDLTIQESLILENQAVVSGAIHTGKLSVSEGAVFQGQVHIEGTDMDALFQKEAKTKKGQNSHGGEAVLQAN